MVSRNTPCPCGKHKDFQTCCGRQAILVITNQFSRAKNRSVESIVSPIHQVHTYRLELHGSICFEPLLPYPPNQQIPQQHTWVPIPTGLYFDAHPTFTLLNPEVIWSKINHDFNKQARVSKRFRDGPYTCNEKLELRAEDMLFHTPLHGVEYSVNKRFVFDWDKLLFTKHIHFENGHDLPVPYTSFAHEMRGEILVQLEKYNQHDEERQDFTVRNNGWRVLGWSIKRAKELEKIEKLVVSQDRIGVEKLHTQPLVERAENQPTELSVEIMGHFEQFYLHCVAPLQGRTQELYGRSMEWLHEYLSTRFGQAFQWSMLDEESFIHFLSVWYLDQNNPTPVAAKVFLNTMKKLVNWLSGEHIADLRSAFQRVYTALIRTLPITIEARKWLRENAVSADQERQNITGLDMYQLATSSSVPVVQVDSQWIPVKLNGFPPVWCENRFWVSGSLIQHNGVAMFTQIQNVYPVVMTEESERTTFQF